MTIVHIVMFEFKPSTTQEQVQETRKKLMALKDNCVHPTSQKPYIKSSRGGKDNSPEGHQGGLTHVFVEEFESEEDRKYYIEKDPAHQDFVKGVIDLLQQIRVVDFTPGQF